MFVAICGLIVELIYTLALILIVVHNTSGKETAIGCLFIAVQIFMITVDILLVRGVQTDKISFLRFWIYVEISVAAVDLMIDIIRFIYSLSLFIVLFSLIDLSIRVYFIIVIRSFVRYLKVGDQGSLSYIMQVDEPTEDEPTQNSDDGSQV